MKKGVLIRGPFGNFVDWLQCAAVTQWEEVTYAKLYWWG